VYEDVSPIRVASPLWLTMDPFPAPRHDLSPRQAHEASIRFRETMASRHSIHDFSVEPFDLELVRNALHVANSAPFGANTQP
jgi:hypothetical protein